MTGIRTDAEDLPYEDRSVTFIRVTPDGELEACNDRGAKREWLSDRRMIYAGWTGRYKTDIFVLNREVARRALKL